MQLPKGFSAGGLSVGIKVSGRLDLGLVKSDMPLAWALATTQNLAAAACVRRARLLFESQGSLHGLVVNSGNANCATGAQGIQDDQRMATVAAGLLGVDVDGILSASTGVIGVPLPVGKIEAAVGKLVLLNRVEVFAEAILTTDTGIKLAEAILPGGARVVGVAKGSGMIHPNMATMFAFLLTDVAVSQPELRRGWPEVMAKTFNQVTVDGDTSTNDIALLAASGAAGPVSANRFWSGVLEVSTSLARRIAADGEGAEKLINVRVSGAGSQATARQAARIIAASALWKAAVHGNDPNWGRILAALGRSGAAFSAERLRIRVQNALLFAGGVVPFDASAVSEAMRAKEVVVEVDLGLGQEEGESWGCDLTEGYVKINAEYTT